MTTFNEAAALMREIAEPRPVGDSIKAAINRVADAVSKFSREPMRYGRAEDIWRLEARRIDAAEMDAIRAARDAARAERRDHALRVELREATALADRLERLAAAARPADDPALDAEIRASARQAQRTARALRDLAGTGQGGAR